MSKFIILCGGTGGHLAPGLAVGQALIDAGNEASFVISQKEVDSRLVRKYSNLHIIKAPGVAFSLNPARFCKFLSELAKSVRFGRKVISEGKYDAVISFGGFNSLGFSIAARTLGIPLILHEANRRAGKATRLLGRFADAVFTGRRSAVHRGKSGGARRIGRRFHGRRIVCRRLGGAGHFAGAAAGAEGQGHEQCKQQGYPFFHFVDFLSYFYSTGIYKFVLNYKDADFRIKFPLLYVYSQILFCYNLSRILTGNKHIRNGGANMQLTASNVRLVAVVLTALCAVSGGIYLVFCKRKDYRRAFAYKGTAGLCFVVLGLLGTDANIRSMLGTGGAAPAGAWLVAAGLIFGLLGDQLLALRFICVNKKTQFFAAGAASFAVGHVLYIIALSHRAPKRYENN